jgi:hypothetical protein
MQTGAPEVNFKNSRIRISQFALAAAVTQNTDLSTDIEHDQIQTQQTLDEQRQGQDSTSQQGAQNAGAQSGTCPPPPDSQKKTDDQKTCADSRASGVSTDNGGKPQ